jgi:hypothetical protein
MRGCVALSLAFAVCGLGFAAAAESYVARVDIQTNRLYLKDERGHAVATLTNNSTEILDIDVACTFYMGTAKAGTGTNSLARLPPRRSETIDVTDRSTQRFDSARCDVVNAQK